MSEPRWVGSTQLQHDVCERCGAHCITVSMTISPRESAMQYSSDRGRALSNRLRREGIYAFALALSALVSGDFPQAHPCRTVPKDVGRMPLDSAILNRVLRLREKALGPGGAC